MPQDIVGDDDVASPIDLRTVTDARAWAAGAMDKRPWRTDFFQCVVDELRGLRLAPAAVLELGSGPGFLARRVLEAIPDVRYTMLDFSPAMHELAREHLGPLAPRVRQVEIDFRQPGWNAGLGTFDAVVTMQAVHELRHKRHAAGLHTSVRSMIAANGRYLVCDHYVGPDGMSNVALYMTVAEQHDALRSAGFNGVICRLQKRGLVLFSASME
jgi:cyclopropane fatty-acyl-phospholipid synthase-like methyltransferase